MASRWHRSVAVLACAGLLLVACGDGADDGPVQQRDRLSSPDAPDTGGHGGSADAPAPGEDDAAEVIDQALAARATNDSAQFAALVSAAAQACPDERAAGRLGEVAAIAERWSSALQDGRPKVQAVTENQLAQVDWDALVGACAAP